MGDRARLYRGDLHVVCITTCGLVRPVRFARHGLSSPEGLHGGPAYVMHLWPAVPDIVPSSIAIWKDPARTDYVPTASYFATPFLLQKPTR
jgi:hypothetical protein